MKEKIVEVVVDAPERYSVGQVVTVLGTTSQGAKAVALAFGLPLLILLTVLIVATEITGNELKSALIALLVLVPYYISLFLFRNKIKRVFSFSIIE
jgi:sigma-E factor negative regulatory protein RseC